MVAIDNVTSLKWVQHKTKPKKTTTWNTKNVRTPLFQAASCSISKAFIYNFLNKWQYENIKIRSTPRSWIQKKSSVYKSSVSSSSLTIDINMVSGIKLKASIVPLNNWEAIVKNKKNPKRELKSWNATVNKEK